MLGILALTLLATLTTVLTSPVDYGVPLAWTKFTTDRPLDERISISQKAIDAILLQLNNDTAEFNGIDYWQSGNVWSAIANQDYFTKKTTNKNSVINGISTAFKMHSNFDKYRYYNDDAMWWATGAVYAYRAYGNEDLLQHAVATWNYISQYVLTEQEASEGIQRRINYDKQRTSCDSGKLCFTSPSISSPILPLSAKIRGGVLWKSLPGSVVNSITTVLFVTLSSYLAEITGDAKYKNAAITSANWIEQLALDNYTVLDNVGAKNCGNSVSTYTYNTGKYIEGLSVLSAVTGDSHWSDLLASIIQKTVKTSPWQGDDGIITEFSDASNNNDGVGFKAVLIRGITELYFRNTLNNGDVRTLLHSYIDVQYNALLDLASNGSNYSNGWHGPPPDGFKTWGQLSALDVLVGAVVAN